MAFKYSDYLITPSDLRQGVLHLKNNMRKRDVVSIVFLVLIFFFTRGYFGWQTDSSLFLLFLIALFHWNLDSRIPIGLALICLMSCPFLLILYNDYFFLYGEDWAEQMAVWAYYFLVFGVVKQMWEFRKEGGMQIRMQKQMRIQAQTKIQKQIQPLTPPLSLKGRGGKQILDSRLRGNDKSGGEGEYRYKCGYIIRKNKERMQDSRFCGNDKCRDGKEE